MNPTISLIISTYNWPEALSLVLASVKAQTKMPKEILIADDGSGDDTRLVIDSFREQIKIPVKHLWHEDIGFTKTIILNKAIESAKGDYIIQIDGDVILHKDFIKDHYSQIEPNLYLYGSRASLKKVSTLKCLEDKKTNFSIFEKGVKKRFRLIRFPLLNYFRNKETVNSKKFRGCNVSFWRKDAMAINGYNEDFIGWGYEDYEFVQRLLHLGVRAKRLKHAAIQVHLYHKPATRGSEVVGDKVLINTIQEKITVTKNGIHKMNK